MARDAAMGDANFRALGERADGVGATRCVVHHLGTAYRRATDEGVCGAWAGVSLAIRPPNVAMNHCLVSRHRQW